LVSNRRKHIRRGFTIIEVLVALSIFLLGVSAILVLFPLGIRQTRDVIQDARSSLAIVEAVSTLKTIGAAEKIYADYNALAPTIDWDSDGTPGGPGLDPPWRFPFHGGLFLPAGDPHAGKDVFPVYDGQGGKTEYFYEAIIYPAGYDLDGSGIPSTTGYFRGQGLYNCQVVVYWKYDPTSFITGNVDAERGSDELTINTSTNNVVDKANHIIQPGMYTDYFKTGRYIQLQVANAGGMTWGLWYKIIRFDPAVNTITLDRPFISIGPNDQNPGGGTYTDRAFRLSAPTSAVVRTSETMITASGSWRPS